MMDQTSLIYLAATGIGGFLLLLVVRHFIFRAENQSVDRIESMKRFHPIRTKSPVKNPLDDAKSQVIEGLESRFSIIRRMILLVLSSIWVLAMVFPFVERVPATMISLVIAATTVFLGIALKPFLENVISGVVLLFSRQLRTGDTVKIDDHYGTVEDISMTHTTIKIWDWRRYIIPNSQMITKEMINYSIIDSYVWAHVEFWVSYEADLEQVKDMAIEIVNQTNLATDREPPRFWVMEMSKGGIVCWVAAWVKSAADAWTLQSSVRMSLAKQLKDNQIYPHTNYFTLKDHTTDLSDTGTHL